MSRVVIPAQDGTSQSAFSIGTAYPAGGTGVLLLNSSGNLEVKLSDSSVFKKVTASEFDATSDIGLVINSDAAGSGADWKISVARPASGMTADWTLTLPPDAGTSTYVLSTDGTGVTIWVPASSITNALEIKEVTVNTGDGASAALITLAANVRVEWVKVYVIAAFDDTPTLSVGPSGNHSKYMTTSANSLLADPKSVFTHESGEDPLGTTEAVLVYFATAASTVGQVKVQIAYVLPA